MKNYNELYLVFVDLEKVFDRVPRVLIESSLTRKGVKKDSPSASRASATSTTQAHSDHVSFFLFLVCPNEDTHM